MDVSSHFSWVNKFLGGECCIVVGACLTCKETAELLPKGMAIFALLPAGCDAIQPSHPQDGISRSMDMSLSKLWEIVKDRGAWRATVRGIAKSRTRLSD